MRTALIWIAAALVLGDFYAIEAQKKALLRNGQTAYLALAQTYPRPLLEGNELTLNYEIANALNHAPYEVIKTNHDLVVIHLDSQNVATLVGYYQGTALGPNEHLLRFHLDCWRVEIGAKSYPISDQLTAQNLEHAAYGELKIDADGTSLVVALCDSEHHRLGATNCARSAIAKN